VNSPESVRDDVARAFAEMLERRHPGTQWVRDREADRDWRQGRLAADDGELRRITPEADVDSLGAVGGRSEAYKDRVDDEAKEIAALDDVELVPPLSQSGWDSLEDWM
jgi:hypothetical protein